MKTIIERTMDLSKLTFYHGSQVSPKTMKIRPPSPERPFYVTTEKSYAEHYAEEASEYGGENGGVYIVKLTKNVKIFDPKHSGDIKAVSKYIPRLVKMMWLGTKIYGIDVDHYETLDLYDVSRTLMPPIDKDDYKDIVKISKENKDLTNRFAQDLKELYSWCEEKGYRKSTKDKENFIRTEILKILDKLGYWVYYGVEIESLGIATENEGNIYGIFNIKAIDKISANRINNPEPKQKKFESALKQFLNDLAKCVGKNLSQAFNVSDIDAGKKFIDAILNTKFATDGYRETSFAYLKEQLEALLKKYSPEQLKLCLKLLKIMYEANLYTYLSWKEPNKCKRIMDPLLNTIDKYSIVKNDLRKQFDELLKAALES